MATRRGLFAELQYQAAQAEKRQRQQRAAAHRALLAAEKEATQKARAAERAAAAAAKASTKEQARLLKEAGLLYVAARLSEVASLNADLASTFEEIDGILATALLVDSYVDLEALKVTTVVHPPFEPGALAVPTPPVAAPVYPTEPVYQEPPVPGVLFGAKKKHAQAIAQAQTTHEQALRRWREQVSAIRTAHASALDQRQRAEDARLAKLAAARAVHVEACRRRDADAEERNRGLTRLINDLAFDVEAAIREYVGIVLSNSAYPDAFPVTHDYEFDLSSRELRLAAAVPEPSAVPSVKEYKYAPRKDEISSTKLPATVQKDRYASAVFQTAVRTLHDVFGADRQGKIRSIALTVGVDRISPATGLPETIPLAIVAADRATFRKFRLGQDEIVPQKTLEYLGAALSPSPFTLKPADTSRGIRQRGQ